jgi:branched-chain amino acid transport system substrate-binding protein
MDGADWTLSTKLKDAKPDAIITSTAGGAPNVTLTKQMRAAGIDLPYANLAVDEGTAKSMGADATGIYLSASYVTGIDSPENKKFLDAANKKFGADLKPPNDLSVPEYEAVHLYKLAVGRPVRPIQPRRSKRCQLFPLPAHAARSSMDKQHHAPLTMYLGQVQSDGTVKVAATFKDTDPGERCPI